MTSNNGGWTAGPWFTVFNAHYWDVSVGPEDYSQSVASCLQNSVLRMSAEEAAANARLIAAAPDLYEALEELCERYDTIDGESFEHPEDSPWFKARAALLRANPSRGEK